MALPTASPLQGRFLLHDKQIVYASGIRQCLCPFSLSVSENHCTSRLKKTRHVKMLVLVEVGLYQVSKVLSHHPPKNGMNFDRVFPSLQRKLLLHMVLVSLFTVAGVVTPETLPFLD